MQGDFGLVYVPVQHSWHGRKAHHAVFVDSQVRFDKDMLQMRCAADVCVSLLHWCKQSGVIAVSCFGALAC